MSWPIEYFHYLPGPSSIIEMMPGARDRGLRPQRRLFPPDQLVHDPYRCAYRGTAERSPRIDHVRGDRDILCAGGILADYEACDELGRKIGARMAVASSIRMTTAAGTDMTAKISNRPVQYETGLFRESGQFGALPNSEINISPIEGTGEGVFVGDVRLMGYGIIKDQPVTIEVKNGEVSKVAGGAAAEYLEHTLKSFDDRSAYNLAEFAVGLNPMSRSYCTNLEDLGKLGFGHHGIDSNYAIGGEVKAPCHIDIIYKDASLEIDGELVLDKGVFVG